MHGFGRILAISLLAGTIVSPASHARDATGTGAGPSLDAIFQKWNKPNSPGCAVGYVRGGAPPVTRFYGFADLEHDIEINADTVFEAGSVSKQFTAASILALAEQGKLALTDDVRKYVPELRDYGPPLTIDQLLNHTSGLRDWGEIEAIAGWPRTSRIYALDDVLDIAARQKNLNYTPGSAYSYTNTGYSLLAIIVQRVSGDSLAEFTRKKFFTPLDMSHTQWRDNFRRVVKHRAIAYKAIKDGYEQDMPFENAYGNGGMLTTIGDLLKWNADLNAGKLGSFITTELQRPSKLSNDQQISYARGLMVESYRGVREIAHSGTTAGYRAWLARYPDSQLSIALLCNAGNAETRELARAVADLLLPSSPALGGMTTKAEQLAKRAGKFVSQSVTGDAIKARLKKPWLPAPGDLQKMVGTYTSDEALATYEISLKDGNLIATPKSRRSAAVTLTPTVVDTFQIGDEERAFHFLRNAKGDIDRFEASSERVYALPFQRLSVIGSPPPL